ncbi:MAG TPA: helicase, partial [Planctomycetaceae bacterium]|nr:helicase [Planctomycetaceae bacterium]
PLYGDFLVQQLGIADPAERIQALESVLDVPGSMAKLLRVPRYDDLPPGELAKTRLDTELIQRGLVTPQDLVPKQGRDLTWEERWVPTLAEKLRLLFESEFPGVGDVRVTPVWAAGDLLDLGGDFNQYVTSRGLMKQEGMVFRHFLRLILLCGEFAQLCPPETPADEWRDFLDEMTARLTESCRAVDPESTDKAIEAARAVADVVAGELTAVDTGIPDEPQAALDEFADGLFK